MYLKEVTPTIKEFVLSDVPQVPALHDYALVVGACSIRIGHVVSHAVLNSAVPAVVATFNFEKTLSADTSAPMWL
jgi:hypothetical protein